MKPAYVLLVAFVFATLLSTASQSQLGTSMDYPRAPTNAQYSLSGGTSIEDFVDGLSNLHAPTDIGTHSDWTKEQAKDGTYDTLTEVNVPSEQTVGQTGVEGTLYNTVGANNLRGTVFTTGTVGGTITDVHFYARASSGITYAKVVIVLHSSLNIITNGVSGIVTLTTTAGWKTATWTTAPTLAASTDYVLSIVASNNVRFFYYDITSLDHVDATNNYTAPVHPTDASHSDYQSSIYAHYSTTNYRLDLEMGWTALDYSRTYEELCIYGGTQGTENLNVDVWNAAGSAWVNVIADIQAAQWNNVSITTYLTSAALEVRFIDTTLTGDGTTADAWQIDAVLVHVWTPNVAPVNDAAASCLNPDDGDNLYARYRIYNFSVSVQDQDGYGDINYVQLSCWNGSPVVGGISLWAIRYTQATNVMTEEAGASYVAAVGVQYTKSGPNLDIWLNVKVEWAHPSYNDFDLKQYVIDNSNATDTDNYDTLNYDYVSILDFSTFGLNDGALNGTHGDYNSVGSITASGTTTYLGFASRYPPSNETDVWISCSDCAGSPWDRANQWDPGGFAIAVDSDDVVGLDTYAFKAVNENAGSGGTSLLHAIHAANYVADKATITLTANTTWTLAGLYLNISYVAVYAYDGLTLQGIITWSNMPGIVTKSAGIYSYHATNIAESKYGLSTFSTNTIDCTWDWLLISSISYFWVQYSVDAVWLIWNSGTYYWQTNSTPVTDASMMTIQSRLNGTVDDWAIVNGGTIGELSLGPFNPSWYFVNISIYAEWGGFAWIAWSQVLAVDILHTIHIINLGESVEDVWITFYFSTNWGNSTATVWDNDTVVGYSQWEGGFQIAKPVSIGLHNFTILINGTNSGSSYASQTKSGWPASSSWVFQNWKFSVTGSIQLSSISYFGVGSDFSEMTYSFLCNLDCTYTIREWTALVAASDTWTGTITGGAINNIAWTKLDTQENTVWFNLTLISGSLTEVIQGQYQQAKTTFYLEYWTPTLDSFLDYGISGRLSKTANYSVYEGNSSLAISSGIITDLDFKLSWAKNLLPGLHYFAIKFQNLTQVTWANGTYYKAQYDPDHEDPVNPNQPPDWRTDQKFWVMAFAAIAGIGVVAIYFKLGKRETQLLGA
jgi:hypothetical protein